MADQPNRPASGRSNPDSYHLLPRLQILSVIGCLLILLYGCRFFFSGEFLRIVGLGILVAGASLIAGFLLGFVFAIPRDGNETAGTKAAAVSGGSKDEPSKGKANRVRPNSNLVEISDWLTKIIVGVGLVELKSLPHKLGALSYYLGLGLQPAKCDGQPCGTGFIMSGQGAGLAIIVFYSAIGFLIGYVWTRLYFARDLEEQIYRLEEDKAKLEQEKKGLEDDKAKLEQEKKKLEEDKEDLERDKLIFGVERSMAVKQLDPAMAMIYIDRALEAHPADGRLILTKARILKRQAIQKGDSPEAHKLLTQAVELASRAVDLLPTMAEPIYNKACYQARLGVDETAILANLKSAFKLDPKLKRTAQNDDDLERYWHDPDFTRLIGEGDEADD